MTNKIITFDITTGEMIETETPFVLPDVETLKMMKKTEIENACNNEIINGSELGFLTSLGYNVYDSREDLANYQAALTAMRVQGMTQRTIKVKDPGDPYKIVTEVQLQTIIDDLVVHGDNLFLKKFTLKGQVDAITQEDYEAAYNAGVSAAQASLDSANALPEETDEEKAIKAEAVALAQHVLDVTEMKTDYLFENINW